MKKALVTGGAGFIGSNLCDKLLLEGYKVTAYDNLTVGSKKNLETALSNPNFKLVVGDVRDKKALSKNIADCDTIFHLAAIVGVSVVVKKPLEDISVNIEGTKNICEEAFNCDKKRVVFTSSSEVYGKNTQAPLHEKSQGIFGPTKVTRWAYGMAKALGEQIIWNYANMGLPVSVVRLFNCYGPRSLNKHYSNVIPSFINLAILNKPLIIHGKGNQTRCFCYVSDTVEGIYIASQKINNDVVNIGSNYEIKIRDLAKLIIKLAASKSKIRYISEEEVFGKYYEGTTKRTPSITKAKKIGFVPKIDIVEGIIKTIKWIKENRENFKSI